MGSILLLLLLGKENPLGLSCKSQMDGTGIAMATPPEAPDPAESLPVILTFSVVSMLEHRSVCPSMKVEPFPKALGCLLLLLTFICLDNCWPLEGKRGWRKAQGCQGNIRSSEVVYNLPGVYLLPTGIEARAQEGSNEIHIYHREKKMAGCHLGWITAEPFCPQNKATLALKGT